MAGVSGWFDTAYICAADPSQSHGVGWYLNGQFISSTYNNPSTGKPYTLPEQQAIAGGETTTETTTGTTAGTTGATVTTPSGAPNTAGYVAGSESSHEGVNPSSVATIPAVAPVALPSLANINVPAPAVTPAPEITFSPEQLAWQESISGYLTETLKQGGRGIPEETMALMTQRTTDTLKAKETEDIRVMRNNMERRGITNSGFTFSNEQKIRSNTTMAIANSITDLNIKNQLMKLASFETAMGQAAQFLGYLGEMSALKYQPKYQTWQAQQQAKLYQYQAKMDLYKTQLQQAYTQQNMVLAGNIATEAAATAHEYDVELSQMEIEAANQQAAAEGAGNLLGTTIGGIFGML